MKKRIVSLENERTASTLENSDYFLVDSTAKCFRLSKQQLFEALLLFIKTNIPLSINGNNSQLNKIKIEDTAGVVEISYDAGTSEIVINFDTESLIYRLGFIGNGVTYTEEQVDHLDFEGFSTQLIDSTLKISSQDQRAYVTTITEEQIITKTSASICQVVGNFELFVSREWAGKIVVVGENEENSLITIKDQTNGEVLVELGKFSSTGLKAIEMWWNSYENQFIILKIASYA